MSEGDREEPTWWPPLWIQIIDRVTSPIACAVFGHRAGPLHRLSPPGDPTETKHRTCQRCGAGLWGDHPNGDTA